jgi:peptide/nickel transport system substrate-binding protein
VTYRTAYFALSAVILALAACGDRPAGIGGTIVIAASAAPERLHPALTTSVSERQIVDQLFDRLARLGPALDPTNEADFTRELATDWAWNTNSSAVTFTLDPAARWHDGAPVRAADIVFSFEVIRDPVVGAPVRSELAGVDSVVAVDSLRVTAWFRDRSPFAFHDLVMGLVPFPQHRWRDTPRDAYSTAVIGAPVIGSGRFRLGALVPGQRTTLIADSTHPRGRPVADRVIFAVAPDPTARLATLRAGEADVVDQLALDAAKALARDSSIVLRRAQAFEYGFLQFNLMAADGRAPHPILRDATLRRALTLATDRATLTRIAYGDLATVAHGPFVARQFGATTAAAALFERAGWPRGADGMRRRNGAPLTFTVLVPSSAPARVTIAEALQAQWRTAGIDLRVEVLEPAVMGARMSQRQFEMALGSIRTGVTPSGVRQSWGSLGAAPGGRNVGGYRSAAFDAYVDSAFATRDAARARGYFALAYGVLRSDAPAVFIYEVATVLATRQGIETPAVRADAWWYDLADWRVLPTSTPDR